MPPDEFSDRATALQALLGSLTPTDGPSSADAARKLSEKLNTIMGGVSGVDQPMSERDELVNEEGLPIVDVTEPITEEQSNTQSDHPTIADDPSLVPLKSLPDVERERKQIERDRILDMLEQEEASELTQNNNPSYNEEAQSKLEQLKAAREMQKKMGKALLRNMAEARAKEDEKLRSETLIPAPPGDEKKPTLKAKKSVSFAQSPTDETGEPKDQHLIREMEARLDWGDVAPARLRSDNKSKPLTKDQMNNQPMKLDVVERTPSAPVIVKEPAADSDDESIPGSPVSGDEISMNRDDGVAAHDVPGSNSDDDDDEEEQSEGDEEFDLDDALHRREIALAYLEKRNTVGSDAAAALTSHTHEGEHDWDQPEVPLEATLSSARPKPSASKFKAAHTAASQSTSLGNSVLPASSFQTVKRAVRVGRLENDQLVGGEEGDSASEPEDETMKEVLELLRKGEVHNIGPDLDPIAAAPSVKSIIAPGGLSRAIPSTVSSEIASPTPSMAAAKVSRFKLNRTPQRHVEPVHSPATTPISTAARSSPKLPTTAKDRVEYPPASLPAPSQTLPNKASEPQFSMIVDSPSFPPPARSSPSTFDSQGNIAPATGKRLDQPPAVMASAVHESVGSSGVQHQPNERNQKKISRFLADRM